MTEDELGLELAVSNPEYRQREMDQLNRDKGLRPGGAEPNAKQGDIVMVPGLSRLAMVRPETPGGDPPRSVVICFDRAAPT